MYCDTFYSKEKIDSESMETKKGRKLFLNTIEREGEGIPGKDERWIELIGIIRKTKCNIREREGEGRRV